MSSLINFLNEKDYIVFICTGVLVSQILLVCDGIISAVILPLISFIFFNNEKQLENYKTNLYKKSHTKNVEHYNINTEYRKEDFEKIEINIGGIKFDVGQIFYIIIRFIIIIIVLNILYKININK